MADRAAVRRALVRILAAGGLDDLFAGAGPDAPVLRAVLADLARGRGGGGDATAAPPARRRGSTGAYAVDRAATLWTALQARQQDDLYRALGVPPLATGDALAARWREGVRTAHPRAGGDAARFRGARVAWETLRDPQRRSAYERWWLRALGPFAGDQPRSASAGGALGPAPAGAPRGGPRRAPPAPGGPATSRARRAPGRARPAACRRADARRRPAGAFRMARRRG